MAHINLPVDVRKSKGNRLAILIKKYFKSFFTVIVILFILQMITRYFLMYPIWVQDFNMYPSLQKGKRVFVLYPHLSSIKKDDVVLINLPNGNQKIICRVVALEGERLEIIDKQIFINGKAQNSIENAKSISLPLVASNRDNLLATDIRSEHFFCLNDNWQSLNDSRRLGTFSLKNIVGKIVFKGFPGFSVPKPK